MSDFVIIEGVDGCGKTRLTQHLSTVVSNSLVTKEPYYSNYIQDINASNDSHEKAVLFTLDRSRHLQEVVQPALEDEKIVICDRYIPSNIVYQYYDKYPVQSFKHKNYLTWLVDIQPFGPPVTKVIMLYGEPVLCASRSKSTGRKISIQNDEGNAQRLEALQYLYFQYFNESRCMERLGDPSILWVNVDDPHTTWIDKYQVITNFIITET